MARKRDKDGAKDIRINAGMSGVVDFKVLSFL